MPDPAIEPLFNTLTVGSLFSGIGGIDLGLERAGMRVVWQCEIDPYACKVLAKHWPTVPNLGDITTIDWTTVEPPDLICGGYPCQPFSLAGTRNGDTDPRHLWPHMRNTIRLLRPRWALLENVPGHLSLGFGRVLGDLAELGYDCEWDCIPAAAVGAPHLRYRVFVVAHTQSPTRRGRTVKGPGRNGRPHIHGPSGTVAHPSRDIVWVEPITERWSDGRTVAPNDGINRTLADPAVLRLEGGTNGDGLHTGSSRVGGSEPVGSSGRVATLADPDEPGQGQRSTQPGRWSVTEQLTGWWTVEPDVGRVADGVPARVDRLRCLGNAVVPQVAELIGRWIMDVANHE